MANPYRDKQGQFSSGGSGGKSAAKSGGGKSSKGAKSPNYAGFDYKGKEGKSFKVSDGITTKYLNNKEFGEFSRQKLGFTSNKTKSTSVTPAKPAKSTKTPKARSFSKAERMRGTDAPRGRRGSKADRMADTF